MGTPNHSLRLTGRVRLVSNWMDTFNEIDARKGMDILTNFTLWSACPTGWHAEQPTLDRRVRLISDWMNTFNEIHVRKGMDTLTNFTLQ